MKPNAIIKLIRWPNLILMALTMYAFRYFVIIPILGFAGTSTQLSDFHFCLIVFSVILIAAGGYVINDYYDVDVDFINKPGKTIIGTSIAEEKAYLLFHILSFSGIVVAFYLSFFASVQYIGIIHLACAVLLWIYAAYLKRYLLIGNIVVSLLCSFLIFITAFYDYPARIAEPIRILVAGYGMFAFLLSLIREIIKDMEDFKGDLACGYKTLPVMAGLQITRYIVVVLIAVTIILLGYVQWLQYASTDLLSMAYIGLLIQVPLLYLIFHVIKSKNDAALHFCSLISKLIMLSGILTMPVFYLGFR